MDVFSDETAEMQTGLSINSCGNQTCGIKFLQFAMFCVLIMAKHHWQK